MSESDENALEIELQTLEAIYINELTYTRNPDGTVNQIELLLHPATGHDLTKQYVCMTLVFTMSPTYPDEPPGMEIRNPRGLGEEEISSLVEDMILKAKDMTGEAMLYTLTEMAKDSLTEGNVPHCPCVVCLEYFDKPDNFHRTDCYHYYHTYCLYKYLVHTRVQMEEDDRDATERRHLDGNNTDKNNPKKIVCPVCRSPLDEKSLAITCAPELLEDEMVEVFVVSPALKEQQLTLALLYEQQKAKGGIIDLEVEKNKYLVNPEDRLPLRSVTASPVATSLDASSKQLAKYVPDKRKDKSNKYGSSFHQSKGRSSGHRSTRYDRSHQDSHKDKFDPKSKPVNKIQTKENSSTSGGCLKDNGAFFGGSLKSDMSKNDLRNEEMMSKERKMPDKSKEETLKRDNDNKEDERDEIGANNKNKEISLEEKTKKTTFNNARSGADYKNEEFLKKVDSSVSDCLDGDFPVKTFERGGGRFEGRKEKDRYEIKFSSQKENVYYNKGNSEKEKRNEGLVNEEKSRSCGSLVYKAFERVEKDMQENVGQRERYPNEKDAQFGAASGFDNSDKELSLFRGGFFDNERGSEDRMRTKRYESRGYQGGSSRQRGTGFESGYKGRKFNEKQESNSEQSRKSSSNYSRSQQQRSYQSSYQNNYKYNRQGEERERAGQSRNNDPRRRGREEQDSNSVAVVKNACRSGVDSETVAQDEEDDEADVWSSMSRSSSSENSAINNSSERTPHMISTSAKNLKCSDSPNFFDITDIYKTGVNVYNMDTNISLQKSEKNVQKILQDAQYKNNNELSTLRTSQDYLNHTDSNSISNKNIDNTSINFGHKLEDAKAYSANNKMGRDFNLKPTPEWDDKCSVSNDRKVNLNLKNIDNFNQFDYKEKTCDKSFKSLAKIVADKSSDECCSVPGNMNDLNISCDDKEDWDDEVNIYFYERLKVRPEKRRDYDKEVSVPRNKFFQNKLKAKYRQRELEKLRQSKSGFDRRAESSEKGTSIENEDPFKVKSVLEMFKERQTEQHDDSDSLKGIGKQRNDESNSLMGLCKQQDVPGISDRFVSVQDNRSKKLEEDTASGYFKINEPANYGHTSVKVLGRSHHLNNNNQDHAWDEPDLDIDQNHSILAAKIYTDFPRKFQEIKFNQDYCTNDLRKSRITLYGDIQPTNISQEDQPINFSQIGQLNQPINFPQKGQTNQPINFSQKGQLNQPINFLQKGQPTNTSQEGQPNQIINISQKGQPNQPIFSQIGQPNQPINTSQKCQPNQPINTPQKGQPANILQDGQPKITTTNNILQSNNFFTTSISTTIDSRTCSKPASISFVSSSKPSIASCENSTEAPLTESLVSAQKAFNTRISLTEENTAPSVPQSFLNFKKAPILKFPKKNLKAESNNSFSGLETKSTAVSDKLVDTEISDHGAMVKGFGGVRLSSEGGELYKSYKVAPEDVMPNLNLQFPFTGMPVFNTQLQTTAKPVLNTQLQTTAKPTLNAQMQTTANPALHTHLPFTDMPALNTPPPYSARNDTALHTRLPFSNMPMLNMHIPFSPMPTFNTPSTPMPTFNNPSTPMPTFNTPITPMPTLNTHSTPMPIFNTPANLPAVDCPALLANSYKTSCLLNANLLQLYQSAGGFNSYVGVNPLVLNPNITYLRNRNPTTSQPTNQRNTSNINVRNNNQSMNYKGQDNSRTE